MSTNFTNKVACKLKKSQPNRVSKSDTATEIQAQRLKEAFYVMLRCEYLVKGTSSGADNKNRGMNTAAEQGTQWQD